MSEVLTVFARAPQLGKVKTRLTPPLTAPQALALHRAFIEDTLEHLARLERPGLQKQLLLSQALAEDEKLQIPEAFQVGFQVDGDLGVRLSRMFESSFERGATRVVVVGSDSPTLPAQVIADAFDELATGHVAVGPAEDGGYYLLGCDRFYPELFTGVSWGSQDVLQQTRDTLERLGIAHTLLVPWYDIDRGDDLTKLRQEIAFLKRSTPELVPIRVAALLPDATGEAQVSVDTDF